ncbi:uncharacterized protein LOC128438536 [Pleuronectes platessa]|uniref:uncharacterized protein LOC128438536 n=1 Tax=Pleuronectes platessa TaxID=8262 RepID=UPI00232A56BA|nr:uncharacterized protein LOC128438536 [Pleuronectes platessa]
MGERGRYQETLTGLQETASHHPGSEGPRRDAGQGMREMDSEKHQGSQGTRKPLFWFVCISLNGSESLGLFNQGESICHRRSVVVAAVQPQAALTPEMRNASGKAFEPDIQLPGNLAFGYKVRPPAQTQQGQSYQARPPAQTQQGQSYQAQMQKEQSYKALLQALAKQSQNIHQALPQAQAPQNNIHQARPQASGKAFEPDIQLPGNLAFGYKVRPPAQTQQGQSYQAQQGQSYQSRPQAQQGQSYQARPQNQAPQSNIHQDRPPAQMQKEQSYKALLQALAKQSQNIHQVLVVLLWLLVIDGLQAKITSSGKAFEPDIQLPGNLAFGYKVRPPAQTQQGQSYQAQQGQSYQSRPQAQQGQSYQARPQNQAPQSNIHQDRPPAQMQKEQSYKALLQALAKQSQNIHQMSASGKAFEPDIQLPGNLAFGYKVRPPAQTQQGQSYQAQQGQSYQSRPQAQQGQSYQARPQNQAPQSNIHQDRPPAQMQKEQSYKALLQALAKQSQNIHQMSASGKAFEPDIQLPGNLAFGYKVRPPAQTQQGQSYQAPQSNIHQDSPQAQKQQGQSYQARPQAQTQAPQSNIHQARPQGQVQQGQSYQAQQGQSYQSRPQGQSYQARPQNQAPQSNIHQDRPQAQQGQGYQARPQSQAPQSNIHQDRPQAQMQKEQSYKALLQALAKQSQNIHQMSGGNVVTQDKLQAFL